MKKKVCSLLLTAALAVCMTACGSTSESVSDSTASADSAQTEDSATTETAASASADGTTYHIGICQLVQHEALDAATQGFQDALTEKLGDAVTFDVQNASGDSATCATITNAFVSEGVDLILANATASLQAASASTDSIPILGTSITDYATALDIDDWTGVVGNNISGTSDLAPLDQQAACIQELFPDAKTVGLLYCSAEPNSAYQIGLVGQYLTDAGITVKEYSFSDSNDLSGVVTTAVGEVDVIYTPTDNTVANNTELIQNIALPAGVPIFAGEEGICSGCGVATLSISYYDLGYTTGEMAYEILVKGADVSTMEVRTAPTFTKKYNAANAEALGITIPDDYEAIATE